VKYTYYGDDNLDGRVDGTDYSVIDAHNGSTAANWSQGDFNYDGKVDGSDYTLIDNAFNEQSAALSASVAGSVATSTAQIAGRSASTVPEPGAALLLCIGAIALLAATAGATRCDEM